MFSRESRRTRRSGRDQGRRGFAAVEFLEVRELLAYSPLGFSLPDLTITGFASTAASWRGPLTVTLDIHNLGSSTIIEPLALTPGSTSSADAPPSIVRVYAVRNPRSLQGAVLVGNVAVPAVQQNSEVQITSTFTLPPQPRGFPGNGGSVYLVFQVNSTGGVFESDTTNNVSPPVRLRIEAPLPELAVVALDVPPVMQPGDTIQPNIRVGNFGPADTMRQGPVEVALVASTTPKFNKGSSIVALYRVPNIPGVSQVSTKVPVFSNANLNPQKNIVTIAGSPVTLPRGPARYYLGVVIDPSNKLKQLAKVPNFSRPTNSFSLARVVGPPIPGLAPAQVLTAGGLTNVPDFPFPFGNFPIGGSLPVGGASTTTFPAPFPPAALTAFGQPGTGTTPTPFILDSPVPHPGGPVNLRPGVAPALPSTQPAELSTILAQQSGTISKQGTLRTYRTIG
ncbi:MAG: hypothetical protein NVSMB9_23750 [Isosphaeraceae bacterium]